MITIIEADGLYPLNNDMNTSETTIYVGDLNGASVTAGFRDPDGNWTPFPEGTLASFQPLSISHGHDVKIIVFALDVTTPIRLETKKEGLGNVEGLLSRIALNTTPPDKLEQVREIVLGAFSTTDTQTPAGVGAANAITVHFGAGGRTPDGEFLLAPSGMIECFDSSAQFRFNIEIRIQRQGSGGVSLAMARMMYASDGVTFEQIGDTFGVRIDDADTVWREAFNLAFTPEVGSNIYFEFALDDASANAGEIGAFQPSGSLVNWAPIPSASIEFIKYITE